MSDASSPLTPPSLEDLLRREAEFRAQVIKDFRALEERNRRLSDDLDQRNRTLGERDHYIHRLHHQQDGWKQEVAAARADVEHLLQRWAETEIRLAQAEARVRSLEGSFLGSLLKSWHRAERKLLPLPLIQPDLLPGAGDRYHLSTSPYRVFYGPTYTLAGWVQSNSTPLVQLRVRLREQVFTPSPVTAPFADQPTESLAFSFALEIPKGRSWLQFEGQDHRGAWRSILNTALWRAE